MLARHPALAERALAGQRSLVTPEEATENAAELILPMFPS